MQENYDCLSVVQVDSVYGRGGAAAVTAGLCDGVRSRGHACWHVVGHSDGHAKHAITMPLPHRASSDVLRRLARFLPDYGRGQLLRVAHRLQYPPADAPGLENFNYPGSRQFLRLIPGKPDIIHCHNLHGGYFDLSYLPDLASAIPTVITLHDAWLLSGHCAHSFSCQRWRAGCGDCPDLTIPPAITVDRTAENWMRKAAIYKRCQLYITTPSKWLMNKVHESMLACAVIDSAVIPNGVDLSVFTDVQRRDEARRRLGIDQGDFVLVFAANGVRANAWKDIDTLRNALKIVAARLQNQRSVRMLAIGEDAPNEFIGDAILEFIPYVEDANILAQYFRASDVYVHAARADTFPTTILEALACGTPVIATAVGGIPEQVRSLDLTCTATGADTHDVDRATGILTDAGNPMAMAAAIEYLANNPPVTSRLAENARLDAVERFDINNHVETYLQWYRHILDNKKPQHGVVA